jgi:electron transfer flavoprotein alpha/beta subunit
MTRILVCFKIIDDTDELLAADWLNLGTGSPDTSYVRRTLGCFDEAALENALRLKDALEAMGESAHITACTINPGYSSHILTTLPAVRIDRVVLINCDADLRFAPETVADILAEFAKENGPYDIIFMGSQAPPGGSGAVSPLLAEKLGLPCIAELTEIIPLQQGVRVGHAVNGGHCFRTVTGSFICAVGNAKYSYLRIPMLRDKLKAKNFPFETIEMNGNAAGIGPVDLRRNVGERICRFAPGESVREKAEFIYSAYLEGKLL